MYGKNIKFLRTKNKLSQQELGKELNLKRDSIASLELERMKPSYDTLLKIKEKFKINIDDLLFEDLSTLELNKWNAYMNFGQMIFV